MKMLTDRQVDELMEGVEKRRRILEASVQSVCQGFTPAMFVWGSPGLGKSYALTKTLNQLLGTKWIHHTGFATPKGLMISLTTDPTAIHLFEDCEVMLKTQLSADLLRAASGAPTDTKRWVTYETKSEKLKIDFTGGIILATNENLSKTSGPMQGVASRFRPIKWELSTDELKATILFIARSPFQKGSVLVSPKECRHVATTLINIFDEADTDARLDVRLFTEHALPVYAHSLSTGRANWVDILTSKIEGAAETRTESQSARTMRLERIAVDIDAMAITGKEKLERWKKVTSLGQAIYYRHLRNAKATDDR